MVVGDNSVWFKLCDQGVIVTQSSNFIYLIAFGSNKGDIYSHCQRGMDLIAESPLIGQISVSRWIQTPPMASEIYSTSEHQDYLNFVAEVETSLNPRDFHHLLQKVEDTIGHDRSAKWLPRELDIDILFASTVNSKNSKFDKGVPLRFFSENSTLLIPHYDIMNRDFLLELIVKDLKISMQTLYEHVGKTEGGLSH